jgi:sugar/nucleoside kinase (ribokinase family)
MPNAATDGTLHLCTHTHTHTQVAQLAHATGAQVVLTAGDPSVVSRHRATCQSLLRQGLVDVLFCNREEAVELLHQEREQCQGQQGPATSQYTASEAAAALGALCSAVIVTDGSKGAHISVLGQHLHSVAPFKAPGGPVDVCGAGDAFAAGVLFCLMQGHDMATAGAFAARVAAAVISRHGAQLEAEDAEQLVEWLPDHVLLPSCWPAGSNSSNGSSSNAL